jgi:predicted adenine nucleotide alpha hydrolase (AANH) superfamily ATPase
MKTDLRLVLVSCCAPCSCGAVLQLKEQGANFIVLFFNPNIYPETEYQKRLAEQIKYCESLGVKYHVGDYDHDTWLRDVAGLESEPERGARCAACFRHRFRYAQKFARENGYNAIASVLGVSRHKSQEQVDDVGIGNPESGIRYLKIDWDKNLHREINRKSDFYRQNYCGCEFSIRKL